MTTREINLYKKWLKNEVSLGDITKELKMQSRNSAYIVLANCAKYLHQNENKKNTKANY